MIPACQALFMMDWSKSAARTNRRGERGSPCLTPLLHLKFFHGIPFRRTAELAVLRRFCIQLTHFSENPLCFRISRIAWCSTLSKAFSKSSFRMIISFIE